MLGDTKCDLYNNISIASDACPCDEKAKAGSGLGGVRVYCSIDEYVVSIDYTLAREHISSAFVSINQLCVVHVPNIQTFAFFEHPQVSSSLHLSCASIAG